MIENSLPEVSNFGNIDLQVFFFNFNDLLSFYQLLITNYQTVNFYPGFKSNFEFLKVDWVLQMRLKVIKKGNPNIKLFALNLLQQMDRLLISDFKCESSNEFIF